MDRNFKSSRRVRRSSHWRQIYLFLSIAPLLAATSVCAQEHDDASTHHEAGHPNHLAVFAGGTTEFHDGSSTTSFSLGLDYERRISELIGVGAGGEFVFNDHGRVALVGLMVALHPAGGLGLIAGPGLEIEEIEHETAGKTFNDSSRETSFAFRVGANYRFEFGGRYSAGPTLYTDFISGKDPVLVWGVSIGTGF